MLSELRCGSSFLSPHGAPAPALFNTPQPRMGKRPKLTGDECREGVEPAEEDPVAILRAARSPGPVAGGEAELPSGLRIWGKDVPVVAGGSPKPRTLKERTLQLS